MTTFGLSRRGLRVLMLIENCPYSVDGRVRRESQALQGAGHQVTVICPRADHEPFCHDADGVRVCQYRPLLVASGAMAFLLEYAYALWSTWWLSWWVRLRYGIDVIHAHNPPDLFVLIAVCHRLVGTRFVFDHHDLAPEMFQARFGDRGSNFLLRLLVFFERCSYRFADQVIVTNESYRQLGLARSGINPARITVVRNGPEPRHFANVPPHESLRGCNATILGFVGEMGPLDGIDLLIDSLTYLAHDLGRQDWRCVLLGSGEVMDTMRTRAAQRGLAPLVQFVGRVANNEVVPYIAGMDICLVPDPANPYTDRCTLIKVAEYMAQAKPIVSFGLSETRVTAGAAAVYVADNDPSAFARAIAELMDDAPRRATMGQLGRQRSLTSLAWEHSIPNLLQVYERLVN